MMLPVSPVRFGGKDEPNSLFFERFQRGDFKKGQTVAVMTTMVGGNYQHLSTRIKRIKSVTGHGGQTVNGITVPDDNADSFNRNRFSPDRVDKLTFMDGTAMLVGTYRSGRGSDVYDVTQTDGSGRPLRQGAMLEPETGIGVEVLTLDDYARQMDEAVNELSAAGQGLKDRYEHLVTGMQQILSGLTIVKPE